MAELNKQRAEDNTLINDQVKALGKWAQFIVKSFRYTRKPNARSAELRFYIIKLLEAIGFDSRCLHKATY